MKLKRKTETGSSDVSLIPIMNLVCLLIPFLLYTASFVVFAAVDVRAPRFTPRPTVAPPVDEESVDLSLFITDQGLSVRSSEAGALPPSCGPAGDRGSMLAVVSNPEQCVDGAGSPTPQERAERHALSLGPPACAYDFAALRECMVDLKQSHPEVSQIVIMGESRIAYDVVIRAMDASRGSDESPLFPDVVLSSGLV